MKFLMAARQEDGHRGDSGAGGGGREREREREGMMRGVVWKRAATGAISGIK